MKQLSVGIKARHAELLRGSGLKVTSQRLALLRVLSAEGSPLTVSQIAVKIKEVNQITIYRALEAMVSRSLVRKVDTLNAYTHYELVATRKHHHHAICIVCGKIEDVDLCLPKTLENNVLKSLKNFTLITGHSLEFIGKCTACMRK